MTNEDRIQQAAKEEIRHQAICFFELIKGFTTQTTDNAMLAAIEFAHYCMRLTPGGDLGEADLKLLSQKDEQIKELVEGLEKAVSGRLWNEDIKKLKSLIDKYKKQ